MQGDLTELLGKVPVYQPEQPDGAPLASVPSLPADGKHPYHFVVMYLILFLGIVPNPELTSSAGQECPTLSGAVYVSRTHIST